MLEATKEHARFDMHERRETVAEVEIPTVTAILCDRRDPFKILVGGSAKHKLPVLPGGKIDQADVVAMSIIECAAHAFKREVAEEVGVVVSAARLVAISSDRDRDVRLIQAGTLAGTLVAASVAGINQNQTVLGRYGVPDYLFAAEIDAGSVADSEELANLTWIDARTVSAQSLGAGHEKIVAKYLESLCRHCEDPDSSTRD